MIVPPRERTISLDPLYLNARKPDDSPINQRDEMMNEKASARMRWKRHPAETGLRAVGARQRGWVLHDGTNEYADVYPNGGGWQGRQDGWYWVAHGPGIELLNTHPDSVETPEEAKSAAVKYVKEQLARATQGDPTNGK